MALHHFKQQDLQYGRWHDMACLRDLLTTNYPLVEWIDLAPFIFESVNINGVDTVTVVSHRWPSDVYSTPPTQVEITNWLNS